MKTTWGCRSSTSRPARRRKTHWLSRFDCQGRGDDLRGVLMELAAREYFGATGLSGGLQFGRMNVGTEGDDRHVAANLTADGVDQIDDLIGRIQIDKHQSDAVGR